MEIFHRHAHSREAKLQVEIARLKYVSPRLRESLAGGGRQQGSGAGESDLDLDRRKIRDGLAELKEHVEDIQRDNDSDTVGFIKKLPHDLVASFRSTLAEALEASLLLFIVDASDSCDRA